MLTSPLCSARNGSWALSSRSTSQAHCSWVLWPVLGAWCYQTWGTDANHQDYSNSQRDRTVKFSWSDFLGGCYRCSRKSYWNYKQDQLARRWQHDSSLWREQSQPPINMDSYSSLLPSKHSHGKSSEKARCPWYARSGYSWEMRRNPRTKWVFTLEIHRTK